MRTTRGSASLPTPATSTTEPILCLLSRPIRLAPIKLVSAEREPDDLDSQQNGRDEQVAA